MFPFGTDNYDIRDKVVMITGAGSGIGAALAVLLREHGARLGLIDVDDVGVKEVAAALGEDALAVVADVRDRDAMARAVDTISGHFGRLDVVVANAGVAGDPSTVRTVDPAEFDRVIDINLNGAFNTVRPALEHTIRNKGHVVIVSSVAAFVPGAGLAPYAMSKAAVEQLGRALRIELAGTGASAGVAYFGFVQTPFMCPVDEDPLGRDLDALMPWPLRQRITAEHAAKVLADGIARRAASTLAPSAWQPYAFLRGAANPFVDARAAVSTTMRSVIRAIEQRAVVPDDRRPAERKGWQCLSRSTRR